MAGPVRRHFHFGNLADPFGKVKVEVKVVRIWRVVVYIVLSVIINN